MLKKLLWKQSGKKHLLAAFIGTTIGLVMLLAAIQFYFDINDIISGNKDLIRPEYIIINKAVSALNTAKVFESGFGKDEIENIGKQKFVQSITPFLSNHFQVSANTEPRPNFPSLYTELFFESIPDEYLDVESELWTWKPGDTVVPFIVPRDYLSLYNFGYALSKNLPQVTSGMISMVLFNIKIKGTIKNGQMKGRIAGFSDRINTILVPHNFLVWANNEFSRSEDSSKWMPSRLLIVSNDPSSPELSKFFSEYGYETNKDKLRNSKLSILLKVIISIVGVISIIIITLAFIVFVLGFQLIITKSKEKIKILLHLGYYYMAVSKVYMLNFLYIILGINAVSVILLYVIKEIMHGYLFEMGFDIGKAISPTTFLLMFALDVLLLITNSAMIVAQVKSSSK